MSTIHPLPKLGNFCPLLPFQRVEGRKSSWCPSDIVSKNKRISGQGRRVAYYAFSNQYRLSIV